MFIRKRFMKYSVDKHSDYSIFKLEDHNLNASLAPELKSQLVIFKNEGVSNLMIDMSNVKYVDSSGLGALLTGKRLYEGHGSLVIFGIDNPVVKKVFEISKLDDVLNIVPTKEEAEDFVRMEQIERSLDVSEDED